MYNKEQLTQLFLRFPGIGRRQAERFSYHILNSDSAYIHKLIEAIKNSRQTIRQCSISFQFFQSSDTNQTMSPIVLDNSRDKSILMIVEKDMDLENIERTGSYKGQYFVLGGLLSVRPSKQNKTNIRLNELQKHLEKNKETIKEVILALSLNPDGEYTSGYLKEILTKQKGPLVSELGRGISTGLEMEYIDSDTFENALNRRIANFN